MRLPCYFPQLVAFYFSDGNTRIDRMRGYTFVDRDAELDKRLIALKNGEGRLIYSHVEVILPSIHRPS